MSSSPGDGRYAFNSPENKDAKPLYNSTDNFLPLGFSTPQHRNSGQHSSHNRNYYSAQPKYMLPRQRGFHNRNRNPQHPQQQQQQQQGNSGSPANDEERPPQQWRNFHNRDWKGQNFQQRSHKNRFQQQNFQRNNRSGMGNNQHRRRRSSRSYRRVTSMEQQTNCVMVPNVPLREIFQMMKSPLENAETPGRSENPKDSLMRSDVLMNDI